MREKNVKKKDSLIQLLQKPEQLSVFALTAAGYISSIGRALVCG